MTRRSSEAQAAGAEADETADDPPWQVGLDELHSARHGVEGAGGTVELDDVAQGEGLQPVEVEGADAVGLRGQALDRAGEAAPQAEDGKHGGEHDHECQQAEIDEPLDRGAQEPGRQVGADEPGEVGIALHRPVDEDVGAVEHPHLVRLADDEVADEIERVPVLAPDRRQHGILHLLDEGERVAGREVRRLGPEACIPDDLPPAVQDEDRLADLAGQFVQVGDEGLEPDGGDEHRLRRPRPAQGKAGVDDGGFDFRAPDGLAPDDGVVVAKGLEGLVQPGQVRDPLRRRRPPADAPKGAHPPVALDDGDAVHLRHGGEHALDEGRQARIVPAGEAGAHLLQGRLDRLQVAGDPGLDGLQGEVGPGGKKLARVGPGDVEADEEGEAERQREQPAEDERQRARHRKMRPPRPGDPPLRLCRRGGRRPRR